MKKYASFYLQNCDLHNVSKFKFFFVRTAIITQLESGAIYDKHPPLMTSCMVTECLKCLVCLTDVLPESKKM